MVVVTTFPAFITFVVVATIGFPSFATIECTVLIAIKITGISAVKIEIPKLGVSFSSHSLISPKAESFFLTTNASGTHLRAIFVKTGPAIITVGIAAIIP